MYNSGVNSKPYHPFSSQMEKPFLQIYISLILILFGWISINIIRFPYGMDYGEAPLMDQVKHRENQETTSKWLFMCVLINIFTGAVSSITPLTLLEMKVRILPPSMTILRWLDRTFISPWMLWDAIWY